MNVAFKALCWQLFGSASLPKLMAEGAWLGKYLTSALLSPFFGWMKRQREKIWLINYDFCYFNTPFSFRWKLWPKIYYFSSLSLTRPSIASFAQFYQGMVNIWQRKYQEGNGQSLVHPTVRLLLLYAWDDSRIACTYNCLCVQLYRIQSPLKTTKRGFVVTQTSLDSWQSSIILKMW